MRPSAIHAIVVYDGVVEWKRELSKQIRRGMSIIVFNP